MITAFTYTGLFTVQRETHRCSVEVLRLQLQVINVNTETAKQQFYNVYIHPNVPRRQHQQDFNSPLLSSLKSIEENRRGQVSVQFGGGTSQ